MKFITTISAIIVFSTSLFAQPNENTVSVSKAIFLPAEKKIFCKLGDRNIPIKILQYGNTKNIICINVHDNEATSVQAAKSVLEERGGTLIKIENKQQRIIRFRLKGVAYSFDPNRIFSRVGIEQTLRDNRKISRDAINEVEKFAQRILQLLPDSSSCVIALHNNTEEAFSVRSYLPGRDREQDAKSVYTDSLQDVDDIILTTDSILYQKMAAEGYNSIWQDNEKAKKDGSLSIYYGERNRRYINIETQHGKLEQYMEMLQKLLTVLAEENKVLPEISDNSQ